MRARRLRRLGVLSTTTAPTTAQQLPVPSESTTATISAAVATSNTVNPEHDQQQKTHSTVTEATPTVPAFCRNLSTDGEHKQKHQKLDADYDGRQNIEFQLSNTDGSAAKSPRYSTDTPPPTTYTATTENIFHQNTAATESQMMDTDDTYQQQKEKSTNDDSGIETMDTNDPQTSATPSKNIDDSQEDTGDEENADKDDEHEVCLSRILDAFWTDHCDGKMFVSDTACIYKDMLATGDIDYEDLTSQVLIEICTQYLNGDLIEVKKHPNWKVWTAGFHDEMPILTAITCDDDHSRDGTKDTDDEDGMETNVNAGPSIATTSDRAAASSACDPPRLIPFIPGEQAAIFYLIECYLRTENEYKRYADVKNPTALDANMLKVIEMAETQIIRHSILLLNQSNNIKGSAKDFTSRKSPLFESLYDEKIPPEYLRKLVTETSRNTENMNNIFGRLVTNIYMDMLSRVIGAAICPQPIQGLNTLLSVISCTEPNVRPICNLVAKKYNFYPKLFSEMPSKEIVKTSFLGPFLSMSVFYEENPRVLGPDPKNELTNAELLQNSGNLQEVSGICRISY